METFKDERYLVFIKPHMQLLAIIASIIGLIFLAALIFICIRNGEFADGVFFVVIILWLSLTLPFVGSYKKWVVDRKAMRITIEHLVFSKTFRKKELNISCYKGVSFCCLIGHEGCVDTAMSYFTLVHPDDRHMNINCIGGRYSPGRKEDAEKQAKEYAEFLGLPFLGETKLATAIEQVYGS